MTNREIDALVAEKVMGWKPRDSEFVPWVDSEGTGVSCLPEFSYDVAEAWRVVEEVAEYDRLGFSIEHLCENSGEKWIAHFPTTSVPDCEEMDPDANEAEADTAPMAICLAALKAVGVRAQEGE